MSSSPRRPDRRAAPDLTHVAVGLSKTLVTDLDELPPAGTVLVLEEPDTINARSVLATVKAHPCVAGVVAAAKPDEPQAARLTELIHRPPRVPPTTGKPPSERRRRRR